MSAAIRAVPAEIAASNARSSRRAENLANVDSRPGDLSHSCNESVVVSAAHQPRMVGAWIFEGT
jgi:hypothetical protein